MRSGYVAEVAPVGAAIIHRAASTASGAARTGTVPLVEGRRLLGVLRQPTWIALTLLVVLLCVTFTELGLWQLRRHDERAAANKILEANLASAPVEVADLLSPEAPLPSADEWRLVTATGTYDADHELLVRNRSYEGKLGYEVVTPLVPPSGPALLLVRGWVPIGSSATAAPDVPRAPNGPVTVSARVRPTLTGSTDATGLPEGQIRRLVVPAVAEALPYAVLGGGYAQLVAGAPGSDEGPAGPRALTVPEPSAGAHLPYAVQWFLFGLIAIGGWLVLVRAAAREEPHTRPDAVRSRPPASHGAAMSCRIEDYGLIGDMQSAALVGRDGSIDWLCLPRFDSGACFAGLLGDDENGHWRLAPAVGGTCTRRRYRGDTLVLETEWETTDGAVRVIDFMPLRHQAPDVVRIVEGVRGRVPMSSVMRLRLDYGRSKPWVRRMDGQYVGVAGPDALWLRSDVPQQGRDFATVADFAVAAGDRVSFVLTWHPSHLPSPEPVDAFESLDADRGLLDRVDLQVDLPRRLA